MARRLERIRLFEPGDRMVGLFINRCGRCSESARVRTVGEVHGEHGGHYEKISGTRNRKSISVIVPMRNEAVNVAMLARRIAASLTDFTWELIFVD